ncbi:SidE phosphodiesterase domain-containing protein, partial [Sansalvadorimonas verongulae]|uniref:SidE phosphodiesterase domain-containing protein n=1 Tax=Sansalvadorimonas verongulae TaxID=2172824 RepID=UPI0012BCDA57
MSSRVVSLSIGHQPGLSITEQSPLPAPSEPRFFEVAQMLVHRFHHEPLPGQTRAVNKIARPVHGAMHQCRAAMWIPVLLSVRKELNDPEAIAFPAEQLSYVMYAAMLHDSGRLGEGADSQEWEQKSGENCEDFLLSMGCPSELAARCRDAIINKDGRVTQKKDLITRLIHDADCLEIMRVPEGNVFDIGELDLFKD